MKTTAQIFITVVLIVAQAIGTPLSWAIQTFSACEVGAVIFYVNGVDNPIESVVADAAEALHSELTHFSVQGVKEVKYLYNPSDGVLLDVFSELATQKSAERNAAFADMFVQVGLVAWGFVSSLTQADQDQIRARVAGAIGSFGLSTSTQGFVNQFRDTVANSLQNGNKTILVAHSQGNMFANAVYDAVRTNVPQTTYQGLAVVNVANPAAIAPSNLYVTIFQDLVINLLASGQAVFGSGLVPTLLPMSPNFDASGALSKPDHRGHGFTEVYLARDLPTGTQESGSIAAKVTSLVSQAIVLAQPPNRTMTDGPITATLTWLGIGDVDLHVFEPQGSHVYYGATQGADGFLDLDNTSGYGPEHYYTSCTNFAEGTYQFGVNYYSGSVAQTATIAIQTSSGTQNATLSLPQAFGAAGNNSPSLMFGVTVVKQVDGYYSFTVNQY